MNTMTLSRTLLIVNKGSPYYNILDELCFLSKNLYNASLYEIRKQFKDNKTFLSAFTLMKMFVSSNNIDYRALPYAQTAQHVVVQVEKMYKSFFGALKSPKMQGKKIRPPKYKDKINGRNVVIYTKQDAHIKNNIITLKTHKGNITFKTNRTNIQQIRIVPKGNHIVIECLYKVECNAFKGDNKRYGSIDLGVNNLCTFTSNIGQSIIYNGRPLKSINQYYNKKKAKLQSELEHTKRTSKRIRRITLRRNNKVKDYLHKVTSKIVDYMETNSIHILFIGKNAGWKEGINLGVKMNQIFVSIPYNRLIEMLQYKCKLKGFKVVLVNEAYTSKCSFLDNELVCKHETYNGKRIKRGLFQSQKGILINADVNGSFNIMRLGLKQTNVKLDVLNEITSKPEYRRFSLNPVLITI